MRFDRLLPVLLSLISVAACGDDDDGGGMITPRDAAIDAPVVAPGTYASVAPVLERACSFASCHGGAGEGAGGLNFQQAMREGVSYDQILVNQPACQYDAMDLVEPNDPARSWLYIKMAGPHDAAGRIQFEPEAGWTFDGSCRGTPPGEFGVLMPQGLTTPSADVATIRAWIENGAPGPE